MDPDLHGSPVPAVRHRLPQGDLARAGVQVKLLPARGAPTRRAYKSTHTLTRTNSLQHQGALHPNSRGYDTHGPLQEH